MLAQLVRMQQKAGVADQPCMLSHGESRGAEGGVTLVAWWHSLLHSLRVTLTASHQSNVAAVGGMSGQSCGPWHKRTLHQVAQAQITPSWTSQRDVSSWHD